ncbi:MAG: transcriptional repressor [Omnitrophica bacterium]|nr:transcriptional repressor [Candidatus Omnitrophota bacterium]
MITITNNMKNYPSKRDTKQKRIILEELKKVKTHPTADFIFRMGRKRMSTISFGTVYRNLNTLKEEKQITELTNGKYSCRYDGNTDIHYHYYCLDCKRVFDVDKPVLKELNKKMSDNSGFEINYHRINFYGKCRECKS